jgi:hypothetical protein
MSFTQELKALARRASEGMDAGGCWREVVFLHRELAEGKTRLGRAAWMMRHGQRGELRSVVRDASGLAIRRRMRHSLSTAGSKVKDRSERAVSGDL